jgi:monoamine oxidase
VKRRTAIKHLGAGLSAGLFLPWLSSCDEEKVQPTLGYKGKVAVIGAGAAGLYAADYLLSKGIDVVVYEASGKLGGRIKTLRPFDKLSDGLWFNENAKLSTDLPIELGSDRVLGSDSIWANFINQKHFNTVPIGDTSDYRYWLKNQMVDHATALTDADFAQAISFVQQLSTLTGDAGTIQQTIESKGISPVMFPIMEGWVGNKSGTSNSRLATSGVANNLSLRTRNNSELLVGNNAMADLLIEGFIKASEKTELNTVVKEINYQGAKVVISGEKSIDGSTQPFTAEVDKVIITVPVSILKAGDITFTPGLPSDKQQALSKIGMDSALRVVLDFRKNFWGEGFRTIHSGVNSPEYFNPGAGRSTVARSLHVTISGSKAEELSPLGLDIIPVLLSELDTMYNNQATENVRTDSIAEKYIAAIQDWSKEPFIKGSTSYLQPGGSNTDREVLSAPISNLIYFAGEATDFTGDAGTVNGALVSAERAAQELIDSIV